MIRPFSRVRIRFVAAGFAVVLGLLTVGLARSQPAGQTASVARTTTAAASDLELFGRGAQALSKGEHGTAIDVFEALADRGFVHPDASYNRGLAYAQRVRARAEKAGDLGRAAAGFEEALLLSPGDPEAQLGLDLVRAEVARRQARRDRQVVDARPTIDRALVNQATEEVWGAFAIGASVLLALAVVLRRRAGRLHVAGAVLAPTALVLLAAFAPLAYGARKLRIETRRGVVVVPETALSPAPDAPQNSSLSLQEAALVELGERRGRSVHVRYGAAEGWLPAAAVLALAR